MLPLATVCHNMPGRLRIRVAAAKRDADFFGRTAARLRLCPDVVEVEANPLTASILILHCSDAASIAEYAGASGLFRLSRSAEAAVVPLSAQMAVSLHRAERDISRALGGTVDARGLLFAVLVGLALFQASEGALLGPAATLLWYAVHVLKNDGHGPSAGTGDAADIP